MAKNSTTTSSDDGETHPHVAAPKIVMHCPTVTCVNSGKDQTVPAGRLLNDNVLAAYGSYSCVVCGSHMIVTGNAA